MCGTGKDAPSGLSGSGLLAGKGSVWDLSPFGVDDKMPSLANTAVAPPTSINTAEGQKQEARKPDVALLYNKNAAAANKDSTQSTPPGGIDPNDLSLGYKGKLG